MEMGRTLFPHKKLPDAVYALLAKDLDAKPPPATPATAKLLKDGIAALDTRQPVAASRRRQRRQAFERWSRRSRGQPFFATVRGKCITSLYDNDMAFAVFGYPGSAWEKGGYITRGFQDLKWLPAVRREPEASPAPALQVG